MPAALFAGIVCMPSCSKVDMGGPGNGMFLGSPDAIVTVKKLSSGETFFQLDDSTTLEPVGWDSPYKKEIRALVNYRMLNEKSEKFTHRVRMTRLDTVRTKPALRMEQNGSGAFKDIDPVDIIPDWLTVCEDGYLTIHFSAKWGLESSRNHPHLVNLLVNPSNPREMEFVHSANGDRNATVWRDGIVAFKISDFLSDIKEKEVILTLKWLSFDSQPQKKEMKLVYEVRRW